MTNQEGELQDDVTAFATVLEGELVKTYGPRLTGQRLYQALGFPSAEAFRQALVRGQIEVPLHPIEGRKIGRYALCSDIARWLAKHRMNGVPVTPASLSAREHLARIRQLPRTHTKGANRPVSPTEPTKA